MRAAVARRRSSGAARPSALLGRRDGLAHARHAGACGRPIKTHRSRARRTLRGARGSHCGPMLSSVASQAPAGTSVVPAYSSNSTTNRS